MGKYDGFISFCTVMGTISILGVLAYLSRRKEDQKKEMVELREISPGRYEVVNSKKELR